MLGFLKVNVWGDGAAGGPPCQRSSAACSSASDKVELVFSVSWNFVFMGFIQANQVVWKQFSHPNTLDCRDGAVKVFKQQCLMTPSARVVQIESLRVDGHSSGLSPGCLTRAVCCYVGEPAVV